MTRTGYSRLGAVLTPSEFLLAKSGDVFGFQNLGNATGMQWVEAKNAAKHPAPHSMVPYERELSRKSTVPRLRSFHPDYGGDRHHTPPPGRSSRQPLASVSIHHPSTAPSNKYTWEWIQENPKDQGKKNNWKKRNSTNALK